MSNINSFVGSVPDKLQLYCLNKKEYRLFLYMVALIHIPGTKKHGYFNWQNDPENTDSTVKKNLSALCRHFCMVREGRWLDPEGYPHIFHMACRIAMLQTTRVRECHPSIERSAMSHMNPPNLDQAIGYLQKDQYNSNWTLETLFSLAVADQHCLSDIDLGTYHTLLMKVIDMVFIQNKHLTQPCYLVKTHETNNVSLLDIFFGYTVKFVVNHWLDNLKWYREHQLETKRSQEELELYVLLENLSVEKQP